MSNLATLIQEINQQISSKVQSHVYFDKDTGRIIKISNKLIDD